MKKSTVSRMKYYRKYVDGYRETVRKLQEQKREIKKLLPFLETKVKMLSGVVERFKDLALDPDDFPYPEEQGIIGLLEDAADQILCESNTNYDKPMADLLSCFGTQSRQWSFLKAWAEEEYNFHTEDEDKRKSEIAYGKAVKDLILKFREDMVALDNQKRKDAKREDDVPE